MLLSLLSSLEEISCISPVLIVAVTAVAVTAVAVYVAVAADVVADVAVGVGNTVATILAVFVFEYLSWQSCPPVETFHPEDPVIVEIPFSLSKKQTLFFCVDELWYLYWSLLLWKHFLLVETTTPFLLLQFFLLLWIHFGVVICPSFILPAVYLSLYLPIIRTQTDTRAIYFEIHIRTPSSSRDSFCLSAKHFLLILLVVQVPGREVTKCCYYYYYLLLEY